MKVQSPVFSHSALQVSVFCAIILVCRILRRFCHPPTCIEKWPRLSTASITCCSCIAFHASSCSILCRGDQTPRTYMSTVEQRWEIYSCVGVNALAKRAHAISSLEWPLSSGSVKDDGQPFGIRDEGTEEGWVNILSQFGPWFLEQQFYNFKIK